MRTFTRSRVAVPPLAAATIATPAAADRHGSARAIGRRLGLVLGLALGVVFASLGGSASAAVTGLELAFATSPGNSSNKSVTAACPPGKRVVGAGADILGGAGQVALGFVRPDAALTTVTVQGREDGNGYASDWSLRAFAVCAPPPPGLERVSAASPSDSADKSVTASCPAGKRLLGTGAEIDGGGGQAAPNDVIPGSSLRGVTVQGLEDEDGTAVNWQARAYAICANPVAGLERVSATSPTDSSSKSVSAACPAGKRMTGAGGELGGGGGEVVLDEVRHEVALNLVQVRGFEDEDGTASGWFARAFAICVASSERVVATSPFNSSNKSATASCPAGKQVTGAGGEINGGGGQVLFEDLVPSSGSVRVAGFEDGNGYTHAWSLHAYAICATPLPGQEIVSATSPSHSSAKSVGIHCPPGKRVVGAGAEISAGFFGGGLGQVVLDELRPNAALTSLTAAAFEDEDGYGPDWTINAYAICANPVPGLELVTAASDPDSNTAGVRATCPSGKNLIGTGADISGGNGQVVLDHLRPGATLTSVDATGREDGTGYAGDWSVRAYAICANP